MSGVRDADGDMPASAWHEAQPKCPDHRQILPANYSDPWRIQTEHDDGNGLWISFEETPTDQDFLRKYHPQV